VKRGFISSGMEFLLEAIGLSKKYGDVLALSDLSLNVSRGEIVGLLGPNGAGKTTAIHIFMGLLTPTHGSVSVLGFSPTTQRHKMAGQINFSSAYTQLPGNLKVIENLNIYAGIYNVSKVQEKIEWVLEIFSMHHLRTRLTGALSSGEKTRLNLCKCFLNEPKLVFLDEPTASLDPEMADVVRGVLKKINQEKDIGMIFTSHNMLEVEQMCDRIFFINEGKVLTAGTHDEIVNQYGCTALEDVFIKLVREKR